MSEHNITVEGGTSVRLLTAGKYCDRDIVITAERVGDTAIEDGLITGTLTEYHNDRVTTIRTYGLYSCTKLISADFPNVKSVGNSAFYKCSALTELNLPMATTLSDSAMRECKKLTALDCPNVTSIGASAIRSCSALLNVNMPALTKAGNYGFYQCTNLAIVDFPSLITIGTSCFSGCTALKTLILRSTTLCTLGNTAALASTPIASGTGYIYVPAALVDTYKAATNWSTFATQFRALEEYTVDGTITGELDETKIAA